MKNDLFQHDIEYIVNVALMYKLNSAPTPTMHDFTTSLENVLDELSLKFLKEIQAKLFIYNETYNNRDIKDCLEEIDKEIAKRCE